MLMVILSDYNTVEPQLYGPRLSTLLLWSQFCHEYLLVMITIRSYILFETTTLKSEVKASLFRFQKAKAALRRVVTNEEHFCSSSVIILLIIRTLSYLDYFV